MFFLCTIALTANSTGPPNRSAYIKYWVRLLVASSLRNICSSAAKAGLLGGISGFGSDCFPAGLREVFFLFAGLFFVSTTGGEVCLTVIPSRRAFATSAEIDQPSPAFMKP